MATLNPRWKPIAFPTPPGTPLFEPVLVHGVGFLVAGGPQGLSIFDVGDRPGVQAKIPKRSWIDGFAVHGTSLYVQDGPVLIRYDIIKAKPYAAINLVTGEYWPGEDEEDDPGELPDKLFALSAADTALQNALHQARQAHSTLLGSAAEAPAPALKALETATRNAARIAFSKPVVRTRQVDGRRLRGVFSLRMDGKLHAADTALRETETFAAAAAPLRAELVLAEMPQPNGQVRCLLHYISTTGSIVAIDATGDMKLLPDWPAKGILNATKVLPLRYVDGYLMGGGLLGHDFFAMKPDPSLPPALTVKGPDEGWRQYDVALTDKLVVLSDGTRSRLVSYDPAAGTRDRWGLRFDTPPAHSLFWTDTGSDGVVAGPRLLIEAGIAPAGTAPIALRAVLANTVDAPGNGLFGDFPPPSTTLDTASLEPGNFPWSSKMPPLAFLPCRPLVSQQTLYCIYRSTRPPDESGTYALAAVALSGWLGTLLPAASRKLDEIRQNTKRSRVQVTWSVTTYYMLSQTESTEGPHAFGNTKFKIVPQQGAPFEITTDGNGLFTLGGEFAGQRITIETRDMPARSGAYLECKGVTLAANAVNSLLLHGSKMSRT